MPRWLSPGRFSASIPDPDPTVDYVPRAPHQPEGHLMWQLLSALSFMLAFGAFAFVAGYRMGRNAERRRSE